MLFFGFGSLGAFPPTSLPSDFKCTVFIFFLLGFPMWPSAGSPEREPGVVAFFFGGFGGFDSCDKLDTGRPACPCSSFRARFLEPVAGSALTRGIALI